MAPGGMDLDIQTRAFVVSLHARTQATDMFSQSLMRQSDALEKLASSTERAMSVTSLYLGQRVFVHGAINDTNEQLELLHEQFQRMQITIDRIKGDGLLGMSFAPPPPKD